MTEQPMPPRPPTPPRAPMAPPAMPVPFAPPIAPARSAGVAPPASPENSPRRGMGASPIATATDWGDMTQMDIGVALMSQAGPKAHQVWLPPLDVPDTLDGLMPDLNVDPVLGLCSKQWRSRGPMVVPLGTIDVPLEQRRDPLIFDLSGAGGHFIVVGGPLTGKSTVLRSLVMALSLTMTPQEAHFYIVDFGGGSFVPFASGAHVAGLVTRDDPATLGRAIAEIEDIMARREEYFRRESIDSIATYRQRRAQGQADDGHGDVFLVIDGWAVLRSDFEPLEMRVQVLASRGLGFGIHLLLSVGRWADLRQGIKDVIGTRFELHLGDASDSVIGRKGAILVPENRPGRGLEAGGHQALAALPRIDGQPQAETLGSGVSDALSRIAAAWKGPLGPKLQLLPERITLEQLRGMAPDEHGLILGIEERRLGVYAFDPSRESHLLAFGDAKSGKTTLLRSLSREIRRVNTQHQAIMFVIDPRRALLGEVPHEYLANYVATRDDVPEMMNGLGDYLKGRLPGKDVTTEQLRARSWWSGPEIWVLVDDYDLIVTQQNNPLQVLQPYLAQSGDVGLHLVVVRRSGGASRQAFDPILQALIELGATGMLLSGSPDEGQILPGIKFRRAVPGRVQVVSREHGPIVAQLAYVEPAV